ncbi:ATP-binding cassette domain-containing protein [Streptacidiphilus sp. MAP5-3]|uniref:ATP-binding cassette domain-containing protein n=1 Tax=unclassified Streptacidiphilus TaxID=2643834 RepID=UPI003511A69C
MAPAAAQQSGLLSVRGVSKRHGIVQALDAVDLDLQPGEVVALVGPPGAGKTTLCRAIHGTEPIDSGVILLDGTPLPARGSALRAVQADIGLVPFPDPWERGPRLLPRCPPALRRTVLGELTRAQVRARGVTPQEAERRALAELDRVGAAGAAPLVRAGLSESCRTRVALARALALDPKVLLVDEPTPALHDLTRELTRELADDGLALLIVTEEPDLAHDTADRVLFMNAGRIVESAPPAEFFSAPRTSRARDFVSRLLRR